ncbi:MAG: pyruvate dehydrogenase (acetyl-transferring), homodimeric type, partial [Nocardioides sp.]
MPSVIHEGLPTQLPDIDPEETSDWLASFDGLVEERGRERARYVMLRLLERAREKAVGVPALRSTDYINTIPPEREPWFPGDEEIERRIRAFIRWNAAVMVSSANRKGLEVGGHIATYQSAASLYEVGFNHFFRGKDHPGGGDQIYIQGHGSPGIYARAFLEGRLTEEQLYRFRQEVQHGKGAGLPSYPHPRLMPDFWEFPTVSMGLTALNAIYQARFNRYLDNRGIKETGDQRVWAFLGDGEMGEPESLGAIGLAAREELDNLTFVVNCNLQQLDGPVRGNGKIIQELESFFRGAGWNVIKVVWGREWDQLLARDVDGVLVNRMNNTPDGQYQTYSTETGDYIREHFFGVDTRLRKMVEHMTDQQIVKLPRGGHDYRKVYAAFDAATRHVGQPTVILAKTIKGWTIDALEGKNATHQMKKLTPADLKKYRDRLYLPISDRDLEQSYDETGAAPFFHPGKDAPEIEYMMERRKALGGSLPKRVVRAEPLKLPGDEMYDELKQGSGKNAIATTMALVRLLKDWMKDPEIGKRIVPIAPDEYRTFGMDSMFPTAKVYNPGGQAYESVDRKLLLAYK